MEDRGENSAFAVAKSLSGWWELAGVDSAVSDIPVNWLVDVDPKAPTDLPAANVVAKKQPDPKSKPSIAWPGDIKTFREMVNEGAGLPGNTYSPARFAPVGPEVCDVMIVSDLPDIIDGPDPKVSAYAFLLRQMLGAIGIDVASCYQTWLATSMPSTGEVPEQELPELATSIRNQMALVRPKSVVILGSSACKALLGTDLMDARSELRNINHNGLNMTVSTLFHPRTLIARPALKAQAWRDLQMFAKRAAPG